MTYDKTSTKKDAYKIKQKKLTDDVDIICKEDLNSNEVEIILDDEDKFEERKISSNKYIKNISSVSTHNDSIHLAQKFEFFMQIDMIYYSILKEIEEKKYDLNQQIDSWFKLINNNTEFITRDVRIFYFSLRSKTNLLNR